MSTALVKKEKTTELDERLQKLDESLEKDLKRNVRGRINGLRHLILSSVVDGRYDEAINELRLYEDLNSHTPLFYAQAERYFSHCEELIRAVDSKIKFAESRSITRTQKQDLYSMVRKHFVGLSESLRQIEIIENNLRVQDVRSTIWIIKATIFSSVLIVGTIAILEAKNSLIHPIISVVETGIQFVVHKIPL